MTTGQGMDHKLDLNLIDFKAQNARCINITCIYIYNNTVYEIKNGKMNDNKHFTSIEG